MHSCTYDKSRNVSLEDTIGETAIIQNKVFFDLGKNGTTTKRRRIYAAIIKNNSNKDAEYEALNVDNPHSTFIKKITNKQDYFLNLFSRDVDFSIYKGTFTDTTLGSGSSSIVNSLCVFHENSLFKKNSYLFLGITEEEYNKIMFDSVLPTIPNTHIPNGADNIFMHLEEITSFISETARKFKLGIRYEEDSSTGVISNTIPISFN